MTLETRAKRRNPRAEVAALRAVRDWEEEAAEHAAFEAYVAAEWPRYEVLPELDRILIAKNWLAVVEDLARNGFYSEKALVT